MHYDLADLTELTDLNIWSEEETKLKLFCSPDILIPGEAIRGLTQLKTAQTKQSQSVDQTKQTDKKGMLIAMAAQWHCIISISCSPSFRDNFRNLDLGCYT